MYKIPPVSNVKIKFSKMVVIKRDNESGSIILFLLHTNSIKLLNNFFAHSFYQATIFSFFFKCKTFFCTLCFTKVEFGNVTRIK